MQRTYTKKVQNKRKMHITRKNITSYKCGKYRENIRNRTMKITTINKRMYEYSKYTQKETVSKKSNIHKNKNTQYQ